MKVTYNWLKEFVDIRIAAGALAEKLTMAGLEVVSLEERAGDFIFEIEITSNRPDWLSVIGVAREVAAITGRKLKLPSGTKGRKRGEGRGTKDAAEWKIRIEDRKDCPLYTAKIIRGVKVGPSPQWLKARLESVGCRSVNNIVDITNYVLFEQGEPLHAFDLDRLSGNTIIVRRALDNEKLVTIDGIQRVFSPGILLIADAQKPVAIAGVMGSQNSEVVQRTRNILLEAAVFNPVTVRSGRQRLGLQSESSYRFERGVDFQTACNASQRAAGLICELCGGEFIAAKSSGSDKVKLRRLTFDLSASNRLLGIKLPAAKAKKILSTLGFKLTSAGKDKLTVSIPAFRQDVSLPVDLAEEL
ncbi:MAG: phenylalanine--tRNA ligase subunit beta, partial [Candidatus Omnitrophota bacterium]|nr:phenylalanine--tRNA ligase subunit beta [Candidatus Omnitrophota bacterium]